MIKVPGTNEMMRLADNAFSKVCQAIGDLSVAVRTLAARLLGSMSNIKQEFLEQTLDKKLMSDMRVCFIVKENLAVRFVDASRNVITSYL